jgi:predicted GNAT family acetyltransferase
VEDVDYTKKLSEKEVEYFRLAKGEIIPVCKK